MRSSKRLISGVLSTILCLGGVSAGNNRSLTAGEQVLVAAVISAGALEFGDKIRGFLGSLARRRTSEMGRVSNYVEQSVNSNDEMSQMPEKNVGRPTKWFSCEYQKEPEFSSVEALVKKNGGGKLTLSNWACLLQSKVGIYLLEKNGDVCKFAIYIRYNIENGESLTKNVEHETVSRILGMKDISMAKSPVSYSERLGYYVEVGFRVNDDAKNLAEIIEPLVAIALRLNLKNNKKTISEIARYLAYKNNDEEYNVNYMADAWFNGWCYWDDNEEAVLVNENRTVN